MGTNTISLNTSGAQIAEKKPTAKITPHLKQKNQAPPQTIPLANTPLSLQDIKQQIPIKKDNPKPITESQFEEYKTFLLNTTIKDDLILPYKLGQIATIKTDNQLAKTLFMAKNQTATLTSTPNESLKIKYFHSQTNPRYFIIKENEKPVEASFGHIKILIQIHMEKILLQKLVSKKLIKQDNAGYHLTKAGLTNDFLKTLSTKPLNLLSGLTPLNNLIENYMQQMFMPELIKMNFVKIEGTKTVLTKTGGKLSLKIILKKVAEKKGLKLRQIPWVYVRNIKNLWEKGEYQGGKKDDYFCSETSFRFFNKRLEIRAGQLISFISPEKHVRLNANFIYVSPAEMQGKKIKQPNGGNIIQLHSMPMKLKSLSDIENAKAFVIGYKKWFKDNLYSAESINKFIQKNPLLWNAKQLPNIYTHIHCAESSTLLLIYYAWLNNFDFPVPVGPIKKILMSDYSTVEEMLFTLSEMHSSQFQFGLSSIFKTEKPATTETPEPGTLLAIKRKVSSGLGSHVQGAVVGKDLYYMGQYYKKDFNSSDALEFKDSMYWFQNMTPNNFADLMIKIDYRFPQEIETRLKQKYKRTLTQSETKTELIKLIYKNMNIDEAKKETLFTKRDKALTMFVISGYATGQQLKRIVKFIRNNNKIPKLIDSLIKTAGGPGSIPEATKFSSYKHKITMSKLQELSSKTLNINDLEKLLSFLKTNHLINKQGNIIDNYSTNSLQAFIQKFPKKKQTAIKNLLGTLHTGDTIIYAKLNAKGLQHFAETTLKQRNKHL